MRFKSLKSYLFKLKSHVLMENLDQSLKFNFNFVQRASHITSMAAW